MALEKFIVNRLRLRVMASLGFTWVGVLLSRKWPPMHVQTMIIALMDQKLSETIKGRRP